MIRDSSAYRSIASSQVVSLRSYEKLLLVAVVVFNSQILNASKIIGGGGGGGGVGTTYEM